MNESLTFDDVLMLPGYSTVMPENVELKTQLTKNISLNLPILSSAMDTVTEAAMAIAIAREGGIGVIHKNLSIEEQCKEVQHVKRAANGVVRNPETLSPSATLAEAREKMRKKSVSSFPILESDGKLVGIVTTRDMNFEEDGSLPVSKFMTRKLITLDVSSPVSEAKKLFREHKVEKIILTENGNRLAGLVCMKDVLDEINFPLATKDEKGRLRAAAAVGTGEKELERAAALIEADIDLLVVDTAHGHHINVLNMVKELKKKYSNVEVMAGNVATAEGTQALIDAGADSIKIGIGAGSICTTRIVTGIGAPQLSAIKAAVQEASKSSIPIIADGGIKHSGDCAKALAYGASSVMMGSIFAGTNEAPGEIFLHNGISYKTYRGMGSIAAMKLGSKDRYLQGSISNYVKLVPEGVEGAVPLRGSLSNALFQIVGGLRSAMGYVGAKNLTELHKKAKFTRISNAGLSESHVHDVMMTKEAPNYKSL